MLVVKYKFDKSIYENLIPVFNDGYEGYSITDEIDENNSNHIIRTIECDSLPTKMKFGDDVAATDRELSLLEILDMNINEVTSLRQMFMYCENLTSIICDWNINNEVTSLRQMFYNCKSLTLVDVSRWDTSNVNNIRQIFYNCENLTQIDVSNWNTSLVDDMNNMFYDCKSLTSIDMSNWNTNLVDDMSYMFYNCTNLTSIDVSNFNTSNVTNMQNMFYNCNNLTSLDVSNFDTTNVTNMRSMFNSCKSLTSLDVSNFNTSKVTDMGSMFQNCNNLTELYVSNFNTSNVATMYAMFQNCYKLASLDLSNFNTSKVPNMSSMFHNCKSLTSLDVSNFDTSNTTNTSNMFTDALSLQYIRCNNTSTINTLTPVLYDRTSSTQGKLITTSSTNVDTTTLSSLNWSVDTSSGTKLAEYKYDKSIWNYFVPEFNEGYSGYFVNDRIEDESKPNIVTRELVGYGGLPTLMRFGYYNNSKLSTYEAKSLLSVNYINTDNLNSMYTSCMFSNCYKLTSIDLSNFNTSNVTSMSYMFYECNSLTSLDVSNFDTKNVTNMQSMFEKCNNLTQLDVSNFNTSNVKNMFCMFCDCKSLTSLDVSNWDTSNVTTMQSMFSGCIKLVSLDLSDWNTNKVTSMHNMFQYVPLLTTLDISNFVINASTDAYGILTGCNKLSDIGMLYCSQDTINKVIPLMTDGNKTIWVKDTKASDYTATDYVTIKDYKEDNRTLYLNSPLLEGDEIVNKEGKLYHYHKMGKKVFDGSGDEGWTIFDNNINDNGIAYVYNRWSLDTGISKRHIICDIFKVIPNTNDGNQQSLTDYNQILVNYAAQHSDYIYVSTELTVDGFKAMLNSNPMTLIYELAEPYYELISDDPLIVQSYTEGKLDTSSIITPTSIQSVPYEEELTYLYTSTQYCIQFYSTADCTVDIILGGTKVETKSVSVGLNKIYITTPSTLVDNKLIINAKGNATISEVVVVNSNAEFDYFDGLKSSFEDCLVTDVDNENYGKYEVGVKIVGKNKWNGYAIAKHWKANFDGKTLTSVSNDNKGWIYPLKMSSAVINYNCVTTGKGNVSSAAFGFCHYDGTTTWCAVKPSWIGERIKININKPFYGIQLANYCDINWSISDIQLEEGTTATSYEPYKETNATIYLNSPLLKGDRIEVKDGKLYHYHKMGKIVLDGSEDEEWNYFDIASSIPGSKNEQYYCNVPSANTIINTTTVNCINDRFPSCALDDRMKNIICGFACSNNNFSIIVEKGKYYNSISDFRQWLQSNPTTVVYELAEPYYEDITPIQSSFVISTVSEGDMEIITDLPIKSNITYLTNITSAVLMEQQLDELDNGTESLTNIVEDEINE